MPKQKTSTRSKTQIAPRTNSRGRNLLLALSLVPLIFGVLLIITWALEIEIFSDPQLHITVGFLFMLFSFFISNVIQKRWLLAAGWGLIMLADLVILTWLHVWAQTVAAVIGVGGLVCIGMELYRRYRYKAEKSK